MNREQERGECSKPESLRSDTARMLSMDARCIGRGSAAIRLRQNWLNTDSVGAAYWPTAAEYLNDLRKAAGQYQRNARRGQRLTFDEAWDLRRLLGGLDEVEGRRDELSSDDRRSLAAAADGLKQALKALAALERIDPVPLLAEARSRLSVAWARFLALSVTEAKHRVCLNIVAQAHYFTAKAKSRLTPDEVKTLRLAIFDDTVRRCRRRAAKEGRIPPLLREVEYAHGRLVRLVPLLASRFGLASVGYLASGFKGGGFWHEFRRQAEIHAQSQAQTPELPAPTVSSQLDPMAKTVADATCKSPAVAVERSTSPEPETPQASHSADFTSVNWFGTRYQFAPGQQAHAVEVLWSEYERGGHGLAEATIGEMIESESVHFRLAHVFRRNSRPEGSKDPVVTMHPAWETMIRKVGRGVYRLAEPESPQNPA